MSNTPLDTNNTGIGVRTYVCSLFHKKWNNNWWEERDSGNLATITNDLFLHHVVKNKWEFSSCNMQENAESSIEVSAY